MARFEEGKIHVGFREYVVTCPCGDTFVDYLPNRKLVEKSLREAGWRMRNGLWRCPRCVNKMDTGGHVV